MKKISEYSAASAEDTKKVMYFLLYLGALVPEFIKDSNEIRLFEGSLNTRKDGSTPECSVVDNKGNHCPEEPIIFHNGLHLCTKCYVNYLNGVYGGKHEHS